MSRQPARETDQLTQVIRAIQRARRSGMLEVQRRINASTSEAGTIIFVKGSIVEAHVGRFQGKEASNILSQWTHCTFTFASSNPDDPPLILSSSTAPTLMDPASNGHQPVAGFNQGFSFQEPDAPGLNGASMQSDSSKLLAPSLTALPIHLQGTERSIQQIERLNLPRSYRQLCLLIDGHHSIADLSRLLGRRPTEVLKMIGDLEKAQCIRLLRK